MERRPVAKSVESASTLLVQLRLADAVLAYDRERITAWLGLLTDATKRIPMIGFAALSPEDFIESVAWRDWPLDLLGEELKTTLERLHSTCDYGRVHRLAGAIGIRLGYMLKLVGAE